MKKVTFSMKKNRKTRRKLDQNVNLSTMTQLEHTCMCVYMFVKQDSLK